MDKPAKELYNTLKQLADKESHVPVANMLVGGEPIGILRESWVYRSWSELMKVDLVAEGESLNYRRILKVAKKDILPKLKDNLGQNIYAEVIFDLVTQQLAEYERNGDADTLYLLELALELSQMHKGNPLHLHLLNMVYLHREKYGTLELLHQEELPEDKARRERFEEVDKLAGSTQKPHRLPKTDLESTLQSSGRRILEANQTEVKRGGIPDLSFLPNFGHLDADRDLTDSQILATSLMMDQLAEEELEAQARKIAEMDPVAAERKARASLVRHWKTLEDKVQIRVSQRLNDSNQMKELKKSLWKRQQYAERILDFTEQANHTNEMLQTYHREMQAIKPVFRSEMGKKISSNPELAERIYNILDMMADKEVPAFDYLDVAIALAMNHHHEAVHAVEAEILNDHQDELTAEDVVSILERYNGANTIVPEISTRPM